MLRKDDIIPNSKNRMRQFLDFVPYPLLVTDQNSITLYLNRGFTETFGWTIDELIGKKIVFTPPGMRKRTKEKIRQLIRDGMLELRETKRMTKDGRILDVAIRSAYYPGEGNETDSIVTILRDVTQDKKNSRINDAMHHISMALPKYTALNDLMDYISMEIKDLVGSEAATILLLDWERREFFTLGSAYEDAERSTRSREIRFPMDALAANRVVETGEPVVISDTFEYSDIHKNSDAKLGCQTQSLVEVPLIAGNRTLGVLGAMNKKEGDFEQADVELLNMIAATVALSIENATITEKLKQAYEEVTSLNRAKDKAINHLSHELRTPVSILAASLNLVELRVEELAKSQWKSTLERIHRSLDRMKDIQCEVDDIMHGREPRLHNMLSMIIHQCTDQLETLIAEGAGEVSVPDRIKDKMEEIFGLKEEVFEKISLHEFILDRLRGLGPRFAHREMDIQTQLEIGPPIPIPRAVLQKIFDGLLKNAIENTPDEGRIDVMVQKRPLGMEMVVKDYGVGISEENQRRIFEGFFPTQETMTYCSMRPFDFNAGGRGADLLRMKIFSERYQFNMDMNSSRCPRLKGTSDGCPGRIGLCPACKETRNCHAMGGTTFRIFFPETASNLNHRPLV